MEKRITEIRLFERKRQLSRMDRFYRLNWSIITRWMPSGPPSCMHMYRSPRVYTRQEPTHLLLASTSYIPRKTRLAVHARVLPRRIYTRNAYIEISSHSRNPGKVLFFYLTNRIWQRGGWRGGGSHTLRPRDEEDTEKCLSPIRTYTHLRLRLLYFSSLYVNYRIKEHSIAFIHPAQEYVPPSVYIHYTLQERLYL